MLNFFLGLLSGILGTLLAAHPNIRFNIEKAIRRLFRKPLVSASLCTFTNACKDGCMLLLHCIELKSNMWLTPTIPKVYFRSYGPFAYDSYCYKPFQYFRERGLKFFRTDMSLTELLQEYSDNVMPYIPDNPSASLDISRSVPRRVVVICELVDFGNRSQGEGLNQNRIVGKLHAAVTNPMPPVSPGATWDIAIISEEFGLVDDIDVGIPANLEEQEPLGSSVDVLQMQKRPLCLLDICDINLTWPLRLEIKDSRFKPPRQAGLKREGGISIMKKGWLIGVELGAKIVAWFCGISLAILTVLGVIPIIPQDAVTLVILLCLFIVATFIVAYFDIDSTNKKRRK